MNKVKLVGLAMAFPILALSGPAFAQSVPENVSTPVVGSSRVLPPVTHEALTAPVGGPGMPIIGKTGPNDLSFAASVPVSNSSTANHLSAEVAEVLTQVADQPVSNAYNFNGSSQPGTYSHTEVMPYASAINALLANPNLTVSQRQMLDQIPTEVTFSTTISNPTGTDPIAKSAIEYHLSALTEWEYTVEQGFSDNGNIVTNVAPAWYLSQVWYPGWSLSNESNTIGSPATGNWTSQSNNQAIYTYTAPPSIGIPLFTVEATINFTFYGNGYWTAQDSSIKS